LVALEEARRLAARPERHRTGKTLSARNRLLGRVRSIEVDGVMGLVEIEAGPFRLTAAVTRDAVEELDLREGDPVTATVKATSVMVERGG
jgi:molybdopterin-binding protein